MKSFVQHLNEFAIKSTSELVFEVGSQGLGSSALKIPISGPMFKRIWPDAVRATVFHTTDLRGLKNLKKIEGGKKSISAFFNMLAKYMESGIATGGGIVAEMEADVIVSARDDIMSEVDKAGRRWVMMSWFENQASRGMAGSFQAVERDLNDLIRILVLKHLGPVLGDREVTREPEFYLWADMKRHLKDSKKLSLVIKDYFDGVEKIIKKNSEVMGNIFYGYARSKRMTDNAWDEQIVNNIKIKKVHFIPFRSTGREKGGEEEKEEIIEYINSTNWPLKIWDYSSELEIYTRQIVAKERESSR
jgi:hypothetical protein